jgi:putative PIN family toxin of toxin-antitoxin system
MSQRIVIDTSVIVNALIGAAGPARVVLRRCISGAYRPLMSNALFVEIESVQARDNVRARCPLGSGEIRELLNAFYAACRWVPIYFLWRPNLPDEDDNFLVELAIAGGANRIVTSNARDLRDPELRFPGLEIITPAELLQAEPPTGDPTWPH